MLWTKVFEFFTLIALMLQQKMLDDAKLKESGKLDEMDRAIAILKTSRDPKEREDAALALHKARKH